MLRNLHQGAGPLSSWELQESDLEGGITSEGLPLTYSLEGLAFR